MSSPLLDVDANARNKASKPGQKSRIPNPTPANHSGSAGRRSPFTVSSTGSPRYIGLSPPLRALVSPPVASKLPRTSQKVSHKVSQIRAPKVLGRNGTSSIQRSSLPLRDARTLLATNTPTNTVSARLFTTREVKTNLVGHEQAESPLKPRQATSESTDCANNRSEQSSKGPTNTGRRRVRHPVQNRLAHSLA